MTKERCNTCQKEDNLDHCDQCQKEFCYQCLGRIENHLYCDTCYQQKEKLKSTDQIIKTAKEVDIYQKNKKGGGKWKINHLFLKCKKKQTWVKFVNYLLDRLLLDVNLHQPPINLL